MTLTAGAPVLPLPAIFTIWDGCHPYFTALPNFSIPSYPHCLNIVSKVVSQNESLYPLIATLFQIQALKVPPMYMDI